MAAQHTPLGEEIGIHLFTAESYSTHSLIDRVTAPVLERRAPAPGLAPQDVTLLLDSLRRLEGQLRRLHQEVDARTAALYKDAAADAAAHSARVGAVEADLRSLHTALGEMERRSGGIVHLVSRVGARLQAAEQQRTRAVRAAEALMHLKEFATAEDPSSLPQLFHEEGRMAEAAGVVGQLAQVVQKVLESKERAAAAEAASPRRGCLGEPPRPRRGPPAPGSLEAAAEQLELYRNVLDNRVVSRFDAALSSQDLPAMAACARVMAVARGSGDTLLVSRYISTRPLFADPKELRAAPGGGGGGPGGDAARGAQPAAGGTLADDVTGVTAMRSLSELYRSLSTVLRQEAMVMEQVFPNPQAAIATLGQRVFEQPVAAALEAALRPPPGDAPPDALRAHLRLLAEAYRKTLSLAEEVAELVGSGAPAPAELADAACGAAVSRYMPLEQRWVLVVGGAKVAAAKRALSRELILDLIAINEEAVKRCVTVSRPGPAAAAAVRLLYHSGGAGGAGAGGGGGPKATAAAAPVTGCLLGQAATHMLLGLGAASDACVKRLAGAFKPGPGADVDAAARSDCAASLGGLLEAVCQVAAMAALLKRHYDRVVAPPVRHAPAEAAACEQGLAELVAAAEERGTASLRRAMAQFSSRLAVTLAAEQRRSDFRPPPAAADLPAAPLALERPTDACAVGTALLAAAGAQARALLHGSNLSSFLDDMGRRVAATLQAHMLHFTFSAEGAVRWRRDLSDYTACVVGRLGARGAAPAFEELAALSSLLVVAPEAVGGLVEGTLGLSPSQARRVVGRREDFRTARVGDRSLAALFAGQA